ncbi:MAG: MBL fold metallo-hydrolase [Nitrospirota bacterium]|nr:MBL fold metallo-hydrolase [Nitrospirota bacterium]
MIKMVTVGPLGVNCYIISCDRTKEGVVVDPGGDADYILEEVRRHEVSVKYILNTHGHFDHVGANDEVKKATGAEVRIHPADERLLADASDHGAMFGVPTKSQAAADGPLEDGMVLSVGDVSLTVLHTPGHTKGGVCLAGDGFVVTGDTLFAGSVGRTDFPGGNYGQLIRSIREKLFPLADASVVLPGHGPTSTMAHEKRSNPFIKDAEPVS